MPLLKIENLSVSYGAIRALHGINLEVEEGKIVALIGANGAGKSTTLRAVSGLLAVDRGQIQFRNASIVGRPPHQIVHQGIVHIPEGRGIFANLTVNENLALGRAANREKRQDEASELKRVLEYFPRLQERLQQNAGTLSGGEQQMLAIARGLLARPKLLMMDEPSLGLAPQIVQVIFRIIREINRTGMTILLVEQNARMALQVADKAYVLETGSVALSGPAAELMDCPEVKAAYLGH